MEKDKAVKVVIDHFKQNPDLIFTLIAFWHKFYLNKLNPTTMKKNVDYVVIPELPTHQQKEFEAWMVNQGRPAVSVEGENMFKCAYLSNYLMWRLTVAGESHEQAMKHLKQEPQEGEKHFNPDYTGTWVSYYDAFLKHYVISNGIKTFSAGVNQSNAKSLADTLNRAIVLYLGYRDVFDLKKDVLYTNLVGVFNSGENGEQLLIENCRGVETTNKKALFFQKSRFRLSYIFGRIPKQHYRHFPILWFGYSKDGVTMNIIGLSITVKLW